MFSQIILFHNNQGNEAGERVASKTPSEYRSYTYSAQSL